MLRHGHSLFYIIYSSQSRNMVMDKRRAIKIMTRAAALYHADLEDQKVIFLYGIPAEIKKQLQSKSRNITNLPSC